MAENFLKLLTVTKSQIQKVYRMPSRVNTKKIPSRHITFKLQKIKDKDKILKEPKEQKQN